MDPAAQAIIFAVFMPFIFWAACWKASMSVGEPSVRINTNGLQSPFWVCVDLRTSLSTQSISTWRAPPKAVAPPALSWGSLNCISSVRGVICLALLSNVITDRYAVSSAWGSPLSSESSAFTPCLTASMGSPIIDPEQSSSKYTGNLRIKSVIIGTSFLLAESAFIGFCP